eukprot:5708780-Pleurochrysis_carterae.AAC.10
MSRQHAESWNSFIVCIGLLSVEEPVLSLKSCVRMSCSYSAAPWATATSAVSSAWSLLWCTSSCSRSSAASTTGARQRAPAW